jgi:hypothetical protein
MEQWEKEEKDRNHGINQTVKSFLTQSSGFNPRPLHVGFMVEIETLGQVFLRVLRLSPLSNIPLYKHILFFYH